MKTFLGIVVLGLLWSGSAYADCKSDITMEVNQVSDDVVIFKFINNGNKIISIKDFGVSKLDKWMRSEHFRVQDLVILKKTEKTERKLNIGWHTKSIGAEFFNCRYLDDKQYNKIKEEYKLN